MSNQPGGRCSDIPLSKSDAHTSCAGGIVDESGEYVKVKFGCMLIGMDDPLDGKGGQLPVEVAGGSDDIND
jgi:hypothetical protein